MIASQALGKVDVSCGNYVSYIQAQERYDQGLKSTTAAPSANLDVFAEGSVIKPGDQGIYVMPGSKIQTLAWRRRRHNRREPARQRPLPAGCVGTVR